MSKLIILRIDAAVIAPELKKMDDETWEFPKPNSDYHWFASIGGFPMASKDKREWVIAYGIILNGEKKNALEIAMALKSLSIQEDEDA